MTRNESPRPRRPRLRRLRRVLTALVLSVIGLVLAAAATAVIALRGSLARLDGERRLAGLEAPVTVTRDSLGVVDIAADDRIDAARALGYLHAQDRFFQMDLQRRKAAGELAALLGPVALDSDRDVRRHRFRARAHDVVAGMGELDRRILVAYAAGVNAGLDDLRARPFEYFVLRKRPEPWLPEDTVLTLDAMFLDLALGSAAYEEARDLVRDTLTPALAGFLLPRSNPWDVPLETGEEPGIAIPDSAACDVRGWTYNGKPYREFRREYLRMAAQDSAGSNNWAVAGALTAHGGAILANDMHLGLMLPNIWYRARMSWPEGDGRRSVVGLTLPGTPALVAGSNGRVAWGFTNTMGDWTDLVVLETAPGDSGRYRTPAGWRAIERVPEIIEVAGAAPETLVVQETIWGPVWSRDSEGRLLALRWTAHDSAAVNLNLLRLESADDVDEAVALAGTIGIPPQNLVCADADGRIAWAVAGRIPRRVGLDGATSESWADGTRRWDGYLAASEEPRIVDPPGGRLWTANNRVAAGRDLALIGDGGFALGARARQIRDALRAMDHPDEADMLALQLDDRALLLERWRGLALEELDRAPASAPEDSLRREFARILRDEWSGRADPGSASYALVRNFAFECVDGLYDFLTSRSRAADPEFRPSELPFRHAVTWEVIHARPPHLLAPWCADWDDFVLQAVDRTIRGEQGWKIPLADFRWGMINRVVIEHPFASLSPRLSRWLAAPERELPGDSFMPRVQHRTHGASERLVVSPGREEDGILHMPGGQSGHPWSPYFLAGHDAWVTGAATPLLPGPERHRLVLAPADGG